MKKFLVALALLAPNVALSHSGHESDGIIAQILNSDHLLIYSVPTLIFVAILLKVAKRKKIKDVPE